MLAHAHTHRSSRARFRSALEHKPVFKSVLQNPFHVTWPSVPANIQNLALARLVASLENLPSRAHSPRKISHRTEGAENVITSEEVESGSFQTISSQPRAEKEVPSAPNLVIGINQVTRALELQVQTVHKRLLLHPPGWVSAQLSPPTSPIAVVFVCCADVDPTAIIDHIPYLIAECNSPPNASQLIKLLPLPKGSQQTISIILGVRRAAVVAFRRESPLFEIIQDILDSVPIVSAPWLCPPDIPQLVPTHIKQLRTTAPKDTKAAREQRLKARAAAKKNASSPSRSTIRRKPRVTLTTWSESGAA